MIYLRLHQARNEEIEARSKQEASRMQAGANRGKGNFAILGKFCYNREIFSMYSNFST